MDAQIIIWGIVAMSLATGLAAGVLLAFSDFVMKSLFAAPPAAGTEAMQIINRKVFQALFMVLLIGGIPVTAIVTALAWFFLSGPGMSYLIGAGTLYFIGVFIASMVGNIPMNQKLEAVIRRRPIGQLMCAAGCAGTMCARSVPAPCQFVM